ncbi:hypothetical protein PFISCL1PPCAC_9222, partial [Pristionchus fissidentatus]
SAIKTAVNPVKFSLQSVAFRPLLQVVLKSSVHRFISHLLIQFALDVGHLLLWFLRAATQFPHIGRTSVQQFTQNGETLCFLFIVFSDGWWITWIRNAQPQIPRVEYDVLEGFILRLSLAHAHIQHGVLVEDTNKRVLSLIYTSQAELPMFAGGVKSALESTAVRRSDECAAVSTRNSESISRLALTLASRLKNVSLTIAFIVDSSDYYNIFFGHFERVQV